MLLSYAEEIDSAVPEMQFDSCQPAMIRFKTHLLPDPTYYFGNRIIGQLGMLVKQLSPDRVFLVTNAALSGLYGAEVLNSLARAGLECSTILIEDGEDRKNFHTLEALCETLVEENVSKASVIIGLGGGCLTNIAGLAAGLIFRGIHYVEMPTTFMGVTDSSLSNKQAINGRRGKNHFGMYYGPAFLFGDTHYLASEPLAGKKAALVEGIKNGLISNPGLVDYFLDALRRPLEELSEMDFHRLAQRIIESKLAILSRDPSEKDYALTLEYGHTFGHAIEFLTHGKVPHGFAVAKGMCIAAEISRRLGLISAVAVELHHHLFGELLGLNLAIPEGISADDILTAMRSDNKKTAQGTKLVLLERIGQCANPDGDYQIFVDPHLVRQVLLEYKAKFNH